MLAGASLGLGVAATLLTYVHGFTPTSVGSSSAWLSTTGQIDCASYSLRAAMRGVCLLAGGPAGTEIGNGWPMVAAGAVLVRAGLSAGASLAVIVTIAFAVGMAGVIALLRRYAVTWWVAASAGFAYQLAPAVTGMASFGSTFVGMVLLPAFVWALTFLAAVRGAPWRAPVAVAAGGFLAGFALTLDGYAAVMAFVVSALLVVGPSVRGARSRSIADLLTIPALIGMVAIGYLLYRVATPSSDGWGSSPIGLFRAMGADVVTLVIPSGQQWWATATGVASDFSLLWGDGSNSAFNYVGWIGFALAVAGFWMAVRTRSAARAWAAVVLLCTLLALGPSLKVDAVRGPLEVPVTADSYLMPIGDAVVELPTAFLYEHVPGFDMMRATYRWLVPARLGLVVLAALAVDRLAARGGGRRTLAVALGLAAVVELAPDIGAVLAANRASAGRVDAIQEVVSEIDRVLPDGAVVAVAPNSVGENDFLAVTIAGGADLEVMNAGGDKAVQIARAAWPDDVLALIDAASGDFTDAAAAVLESGAVQYVVVPYFDLRWNSYTWPATAEFREPGVEAAQDLKSDGRFEVVEREHFAVASLGPVSNGG